MANGYIPDPEELPVAQLKAQIVAACVAPAMQMAAKECENLGLHPHPSYHREYMAAFDGWMEMLTDAAFATLAWSKLPSEGWDE